MIEHERNIQKERLEFIASSAAQIVKNRLNEAQSLVQQIVDSDEFEKYSTSFQELPLVRLFAMFVKDFPELGLVNIEGKEVVKVIRGKVSEQYKDLSKDPAFQAALSKPNQLIINPPEYSPIFNTAVIRFSVAKYSYFGDEFRSAFVGTRLLGQITSDIDQLKIEKNGFVILIDSQGTILACPQKTKILTKIEAGNEQGRQLLSDALQHKAGYARGIVLGIDGLVTYAPLKDYDWSVLAILPYSDFMKAPNILRNISIGTFCLVFILGWIVSFILVKGITISIARLVERTRALANGDFSKKVIIKSNDEISALGLSFNKMTSDLESFLKREKEFIVAETKMAAEKKKADELATLNEQLREKEKRFEALNQQLMADEEKLKTTNQQLHENEKSLLTAQEDLKKKVSDLEFYKDVTIQREIKMMELKKEINALLRELGRDSKYVEGI